MNVKSAELGEVEIAEALAGELRSSRRLLPEDVIYSALADKQPEVALWIRERLAGRFLPAPEEIVSVSKGAHGVRPVAIWDLPSRVGYRALAARLAKRLPPVERSRDSWKDFRRSPLGGSAQYIVASDIAACYQNLDHGLIAEELLVQTGDHQAIDALIELVQQTSGRTYGLPQQSWASDVLAEAFMDRLERALVRRGLATHRYNDDFLFSCGSWAEAIRSIDVFDEECRRVGLGVNDQKTITWKTGTYETQLDDAETLRAQIAAEAEFDLAFFFLNPYTEEEGVEPPDTQEVDIEASRKILERWDEVAGSGHLSDASTASEHRALVELLPSALSLLSKSGESEPDVLETCGHLLRTERTLTPSVARYIASCEDEEVVLEAFDALLADDAYLSGWQTWWLQTPIARREGFAAGKGAGSRLAWLASAMESAAHAPLLRAEVARSLAWHKELGVDELLSFYDRSSNIVRPTLVAALALVAPSKAQLRSVVGDSRLHKWVFEWVSVT